MVFLVYKGGGEFVPWVMCVSSWILRESVVEILRRVEEKSCAIALDYGVI